MKYERCSDWISLDGTSVERASLTAYDKNTGRPVLKKVRDYIVPPLGVVVIVKCTGRFGSGEILAKLGVGGEGGGIRRSAHSVQIWRSLDGERLVPSHWARVAKSSLRRTCWNRICELFRNRKRDTVINAPNGVGSGSYEAMKKSALAALPREKPTPDDLRRMRNNLDKKIAAVKR